MKRLGGGEQRQRGSCNGDGYGQAQPFRRCSKGLACAVLASLAALLDARSEAEPFKCTKAHQGEVLVENDVFKPAQTGQSLPDPWCVRTGVEGRLMVSTAALSLEIPPLSEVSLDRSAPHESATAAGSFLRPAPLKSKDHEAPSNQLRLHRGTLFIHAGPRRISLRAGQTRVEARSALFAVSTSLASGELVSVLKGQVKVHNPDNSITFVSAGKALRTTPGAPARIGSLEEMIETMEHKRELLALEQAPPPFSAPGLDAEQVGRGTQTPFDLNERRRDALLTAPNDPNIGRPDVSPELPRNVQSTP